MGTGTMDATRFEIIFIMGLMAFGARVLPQILFVGGSSPRLGIAFSVICLML